LTLLDFSPLSFRHGCLETVPSTCTATDVSALRWVLHANHDYYVTIKVTNLAGLTTLATSHPYKHNVRIPSPGIVYDVNPLSTGSSSFAVSNIYYNTLCLRYTFVKCWFAYTLFLSYAGLTGNICIHLRWCSCHLTVTQQVSLVDQELLTLHFLSFFNLQIQTLLTEQQVSSSVWFEHTTISAGHLYKKLYIYKKMI
jgi:hypothetical protein